MEIWAKAPAQKTLWPHSTTLEITQHGNLLIHRTRDTIQLLQQETPDFIGPDLWLPNSPDLNPVDYKIWVVMQQRVYERRMNNVDELKQRLIAV